MKKITTTILAIALVAIGTMFIFAQTTDKTDGKRGFGKHGFGRGGDRHGRAGMMLRGLDLTEEQKAQVKQIRDVSRQTMQPIHEQMRANHKNLAELTANGNYDAAQVQTIAAQIGNLTAQMIVEKEKVQAQIFQILTPEQKAKAAELRAQKKERRGNKAGRAPANQE